MLLLLLCGPLRGELGVVVEGEDGGFVDGVGLELGEGGLGGLRVVDGVMAAMLEGVGVWLLGGMGLVGIQERVECLRLVLGKHLGAGRL